MIVLINCLPTQPSPDQLNHNASVLTIDRPAGLCLPWTIACAAESDVEHV